MGTRLVPQVVGAQVALAPAGRCDHGSSEAGESGGGNEAGCTCAGGEAAAAWPVTMVCSGCSAA